MEGGDLLCGVIYFLPPIPPAGVHLFQVSMNFNMLQNICGSEAMKNVLFLSTNTRSPWTFFSADFLPLLRQGLGPIGYDWLQNAARSSIRRLIHFAPCALRIQRELVEYGWDITKTCAHAGLMSCIARENSFYLEALMECSTDGRVDRPSYACSRGPPDLVAYMRRATCSRLSTKLAALQSADEKLSETYHHARTFWKAQGRNCDQKVCRVSLLASLRWP